MRVLVCRCIHCPVAGQQRALCQKHKTTILHSKQHGNAHLSQNNFYLCQKWHLTRQDLTETTIQTLRTVQDLKITNVLAFFLEILLSFCDKLPWKNSCVCTHCHAFWLSRCCRSLYLNIDLSKRQRRFPSIIVKIRGKLCRPYFSSLFMFFALFLIFLPAPCSKFLSLFYQTSACLPLHCMIATNMFDSVQFAQCWRRMTSPLLLSFQWHPQNPRHVPPSVRIQ